MPTPIQQALTLAADRGLLPTSMGTADLRELERSLLDRSFWSARTTHARYLKDLKALVERYVKGEGYNNDLAQLRIEARKLLVRYGYEPEKGFPGDAALGVPEAVPGSLQDLSSERRLNLIFDTQSKLMRGLGQKIRGLDRMETAPAWELVRIEDRRAPRDWLERWAIAADNVDSAGVYDLPGRMVARKDSPIWAALGSSALFDDALDVDHSPFAFQSGMGWLEVFAVDLPELQSVPDPRPLPANVIPFVAPEPEIFIGGQSTLDMLAARLRARQAAAEAARS
ncbi:hypothetical protein GCM10023213_14030 [Prosthecobacter algae]|uniref:Core-binding (CB) domain-containing protein n=1 Tax=Prosthecobacter algae TaxID=1144682 RepID=A0ABP9P059_9BACT